MNTRKLSYKIFHSVIFVLIALPMLFPIYWLIITSIKPQSEIFSMPPTLFPKDFTLENYVEVANNYNILKYFANSMFLTIVSTVIIMIIATFGPMPSAGMISKAAICFM